jgi:hypothetical protein
MPFRTIAPSIAVFIGRLRRRTIAPSIAVFIGRLRRRTGAL